MSEREDLTADEIQVRLTPLTEGRVEGWQGLPEIYVGKLVLAYGAPQISNELLLGWYPARRLRFDRAGFDAYERAGEIVMVEPQTLPGSAVLDVLGEPSKIMPHELERIGAYVHEYVYGPRGLVLSVAQSFDERTPLEIVRVRGIRPLTPDAMLGPDLHRALEDRTAW